jgi:hypothetical protein
MEWKKKYCSELTWVKIFAKLINPRYLRIIREAVKLLVHLRYVLDIRRVQ